jgi:hypothetical protein
MKTMHRRIMAAGGQPRTRGGSRRIELDVAAIAAGYLDGKTIEELAAQYGVAMGTIYDRLVAAGVPRRQRGRSHQWDDLPTSGGRLGTGQRVEAPARAPRPRSPLTRACPVCGAKPGRKCQRQIGNGSWRPMEKPHQERRQAPAGPDAPAIGGGGR